MRNFSALCLFILLTSATVCTQAAADDFITLNLPEAVIAKATEAILPIRIDAHSKSIEGDITIINISEVELTENHLTCRLHLAGRDLAFLTEIAGHEIRLKAGSVEIDFKTDAAIRFDAKQQTLFIKPVVQDVANGSAGSSADIGQALVALLNGREFPITMQKLDPLIARAGSKTIIINSTITDIKARAKYIQLSLLPNIATQ
ncbi:MAG: hypothetical protein WBB19_03460 [Desulforhopalus sp.]